MDALLMQVPTAPTPLPLGKRPVVFVTQVPTRKDRTTGLLSPSVNIGPAAEHGDLHVLMPSGASFYASQDLVHQLRDKLKPYDFTRGDCILALGDPAILTVTGSLIARYTNRYRILKWDRRIERYISVEINL